MNLEFYTISEKGEKLSKLLNITISAQNELQGISASKELLEEHILCKIKSQERKWYYCYVSENNEPIGYRVGREGISRMPRVFESMQVYVSPEYRRENKGTVIKEHQIKFTIELGFDRHRTGAYKKNIPATKILKSLNFKKEHKEKGYVTYLLKYNNNL